MEKQVLDEKIAEVTKSIFSYCTARTQTQQEAEDLAQDIILECYKSAANIRNENAFYGFMWSVANNVYKQWCRKKVQQKEVSLREDWMDDTEILWGQDSDVHLLRRELTLLTEKYRRATILYYMENKSCAEIAKLLSVSESMVKYLLFKSRQILKEGMTMERTYGEQSYHPKGLDLLFWGQGANRYYHLCDNKVSQNILFACYNDKLTVEQISLEIGVALPYMEDNLKELLEYDLIKKEGNKYYTNIVIFTKDFAQEVDRKTAALRQRIVDIIIQTMDEKQAQIREIGFAGADMHTNSFLWQMTCILLYRAIIQKVQSTANVTYPKDKFGVHCFIWGAEQFAQSTWKSQFGFGISDTANQVGDRIQFMDFPINGEMVHHYYFNKQNITNIFLDIAKGNTDNFSENDKACVADMVKKGYVRCTDGHLSVNTPVFTKAQFAQLLHILDAASAQIAAETEILLASVSKILQNHVPVHLKKAAKDMAYLRLFEDAISAPVSILFERKYLLPYSEESLLPTTYVVLA